MNKDVKWTWWLHWMGQISQGLWSQFLGAVLFSSIYAASVIYVGQQVEGLGMSQLKAVGLSALFVVLFRFLSGVFNDLAINHLHKNALVWMSEKLQRNLPNLLSRWSKDHITYALTVNYPQFCETTIHGFVQFVSSALVSMVVLVYLLGHFSSTLPRLFVFVAVGLGVSFVLQRILKKLSEKIDHVESQKFKKKQFLIDGFEQLKVSDTLDSWSSQFSVMAVKWLGLQRKVSRLQHATSTLNWGAKYVFVLLIITPLLKNTPVSPSDAYWLYIVMGLIIQFFWITYQIGQAKIHFSKSKILITEPDFKDSRSFSDQLEIQAGKAEIYFGPHSKERGTAGLKFGAKAGDVLWVEGPSGAGKTTLLKTILGLHQNFSGSISVPSKEFKIGYLSQPAFIPQGQPLSQVLGVDQLSNKELKLIDRLDLTEFFRSIDWNLEFRFESEGFTPSAGQKTRLALLRELIKDPKILVLDEPSANLDGKLAKKIFSYLKEETSQRITIIADHNLELQNILIPSSTVNL